MSNLINIQNQKGTLTVSSQEVAKHFEKEHSKVTRDIESVIEGVAKNGDTYDHLFIESEYQHPQNREEVYDVQHTTTNTRKT